MRIFIVAAVSLVIRKEDIVDRTLSLVQGWAQEIPFLKYPFKKSIIASQIDIQTTNSYKKALSERALN